MHKKKAFLLVEVLVYISISIILISISFTMMFSLVKTYKETLEESKVITYENACCLNINRLLKRKKIKTITDYNNSICINFIDEDINIIKRKNNNLIIEYHTKEGIQNSVLIKDITEFLVVKKKKVIYLTIVKGGISYKWCI